MATPEQTALNNVLMNLVMEMLGAKNDARLSAALGIMPPVLSKIRHGTLPIGATVQIRIHVTTGMPFKRIYDFVPSLDYTVRGRMAPKP